MQSKIFIPLVMCLLALISGCGQVSDSLLFGSEGQQEKTRCPGDHEGFYVCLSSSSSISDADLVDVIQQALKKLASLVNSNDFQQEIESSYTSGAEIVSTLVSTNYIVDIDGYCDAETSELAKAKLGGNQIYYNECRVQKDANGKPALAHVAGVLLHEISHNIGYSHPDENPSITTVPYFLGNLAESKLGGNGHADSSIDRPETYHKSRDEYFPGSGYGALSMSDESSRPPVAR